MDSDRIRRIEEIIELVVDLAADERNARLESLCGDDVDLRREIEDLLAVQGDAKNYFDGFRESVGNSAGAELDVAAVRERRIGPWELSELIGRGGMAAVYRAERTDDEFEQTAALKLLRRGLDTGPAAERFIAERQILAQLEHPHIARLIDGGITDDGLPYLVLEYVDGLPITEYCNGAGLTVRQRLALFCDVIDAVQYAHRNLVVHRDLKPSNILVTEEGRVKLLDFGIAKLIDDTADSDTTRTEHRVMTPAYAAPEQVSGGQITTATDVYSLGVLLYELLAGRRPYEVDGLTAADTERVITQTNPPAPSAVVEGAAAAVRGARAERLRRTIAGDLDNICLMALRKEPERRYASAGQLGEDIEHHVAGRPVRARPDTVGYRAGKFIGRHRIGVAATAAVAVLVIGFAITMAVISAQLARERELSDRVIELFVDVFATADPSQGATITAREVLDRGADRIEAELAGQPEVQAELLDVMGRVYRNLGLYDQAVDLLQTSTELLEQADSGSDRFAASLDALGEAQRLKGDYEVAEDLLRRAVALNIELEGEDDLRTARSMTTLGRVLVARGSYEEAASTLQRSLGVQRADPAAPADLLADTLDTLGSLALVEARFDDAGTLFQESIDLRRGVYGDNHPLIGTSLNNLATAAGRSGDQIRAEQLQREALGVYVNVFGESHPNVATAQNNLALTLFFQGKYDESEALMLESMAMRRELLDAEHADIAQSASNLGLVLQTVGRLDEAADLYEEALAIRRAAFGDQHLRTAQTINNLGLLEQKLGNLETAEALLAEGLETFRALFGEQHPLTATNMSNLASVQLDRGDFEEAERNYRESLAIRRAVLPEGHMDTSYSLVGLARLLSRRGAPEHLQEATEKAREALEIRRAGLPDGHPLIAEPEDLLVSLQRRD